MEKVRLKLNVSVLGRNFVFVAFVAIAVMVLANVTVGLVYDAVTGISGAGGSG